MFDPDQLPVPDLGLRCKRCGYPLAYLSEHRCPECGGEFTLEQFIPPGAVPLLIADGKLVLGTADITDLLDRYGISYVKQTEHAAELFGNFGIFQSRPAAPLAVPRDQYLEAIDLIRRDALNEPMPDPPPPPPQEAWICPHCHEKNPPNFELCWNCGQAPETDQQP